MNGDNDSNKGFAPAQEWQGPSEREGGREEGGREDTKEDTKVYSRERRATQARRPKTYEVSPQVTVGEGIATKGNQRLPGHRTQAVAGTP